ncbi:MAG: threonine ammonia-lyase [Thermoplasmatota archaeon]
MTSFDLDLADIERAAKRIEGRVARTPLVESPLAPGLLFKLENLQRTGAFKIRGATNAVSEMTDAELARGVSCVSAGNHGLAVAVAARERDAHARVFVPEHAVARKVEAIRAEGAEVIHAPHTRLAEILERGDAGDGTTFLSPFADARVIAGQGTLGLEIAQDLPAARTVLVPLGGGGLALGVATAVRALLPHANVYGVWATGAPAVSRALHTGRIEVVKPTSIADGLGAPRTDIRVVDALRSRLSGLFEVSDDDIRAAMRALALGAKIVAEPAGAAATAAALLNPELHRPVVAVVSGGNVDPKLLAEVLA